FRCAIMKASPARPAANGATDQTLHAVPAGNKKRAGPMKDRPRSVNSASAGSIELARDGFDAVALDDVAGTHVLVTLEGHTAFLTSLYLADLVLEALEGRERAFVD